MRKITNEFKEFQNSKGIDVYYNDLTCYITIAKGNNIIYEFYDGDTWDRAFEQIIYTIEKY